MLYRTFGKTGERVSLLGFGAMRLPTAGGKVDEAESIRMIRHAIDSGVNYVDTAYMYHDGVSEEVVGKALKDGYREKVFLADKLPPWFAKDESDLPKIFETQLKRLDTDIDMYLVHSIEEGHMGVMKELNTYGYVSGLRDSGKIKRLGFSYHGKTTKFFKEVIDSLDWDFCQIQLNYMDKDIQAGVEGLKYAGGKGIAVVVMEPLKGGKLTGRVPDSIQSLWNGAPVPRTPAEWGLRWVANFPEATTILSGMTTMEQLDENLRILSDAKPDALTPGELALIDEASAEYNELIKYGCTSCAYCLPECPQKIDIPSIIGLNNDTALYDCFEASQFSIQNFVEPKPSACIECKKCEDICPQHLHIADIMKESAELYER
ncbi:MAG: aldo/keto reductase [Clostridiales Family XIII bacterium]|jgi:predicted aldo/keto reductase-like oxidoreductase|nr:aldo/keto reductase [Clostridiales Family XIII bacterium]